MAKGAYIGVNNVARKIKKGYIGVDGVARKIKKAYIGVNGIARLFWSAGPPAITTRGDLGVAVANVALTDINDKYVLFKQGGTRKSKYVYIYDSSLTQLYSTVNGLMVGSANSVGTYGILISKSTSQTYHCAYNESLTETTVSFDGEYASGDEVPNIKLGNYLVIKRRVLNSSLTVQTLSTYPVLGGSDHGNYDHWTRTGIQIGNYGVYNSGKNTFGTINTSLTVNNTAITKTNTNYLADYATWATAGNKYAISASGDDGENETKDAYAINASLTLVTTSISAAKSGLASFSLGDYAVYSGGDYESAYHKTEIEMFDTSLTLTMSNTYRSVDSYNVGGVAFDGIGMFIGGIKVGTTSKYISNADILTL